MKEHNIKLDESDVSVVADLEEQITTLKGRLDAQINENANNINQNLEYEKALALMTMTEDCTFSQREKAKTLMADIDCKDLDSFKSKLSVIIGEFNESNNNFDDDDFRTIDLNEEVGKRKSSSGAGKKTKADKLLDGF